MFWQQVTDTGTVGYYIYKDYVKIDTVNNSSITSYQISFTDINTHVYSVVAFNTNNPPTLPDRPALGGSHCQAKYWFVAVLSV
jgi:hypothetical protein